MRKALVFLLIATLLPFEVVAQKTGFFEEGAVDFFGYVSEKCRNSTGPEEPYQIAMSLRDSKNEKEKLDAADCLLVAALWGGDGPAQFELARMYSTGTIFPQSDYLAYRWAQLAYMDGNKDAIILRDRLEPNLSIEEIDMALAGANLILEGRKMAKEGRFSEYLDRQKGKGGKGEADEEQIQFDPETGEPIRPVSSDYQFSFQTPIEDHNNQRHP